MGLPHWTPYMVVLSSIIEWFAALYTIVQLFSGVYDHMYSQPTSNSKWFAALYTLVQFLFSVNSHMDFECTSPTKRFAALSTLVELFCRMGKLVNLQTSRMVKCFLALVTFAKFLSTAVGCNKVHKGSGVCLWTQVTRIGLCYPKVWTLCTEWSSGTEDVMSAST